MARRTPEQWQSLLAEQANSGLSVAEFCRQRQFSTKAFYAGRRRYQGAAKQSVSASEFIQLRPVSTPSMDIRLDFDSFSAHLPTSCDPQWLATLLKELAR